MVRDNHFAGKNYNHPGNIVLKPEQTDDSRENKYKAQSQHPTTSVDIEEGILASLERQYLGGISLSADMRLRVYNIAPYGSPIVRACTSGDVATLYSLCQSGRASVFDMVGDSGQSLLDLTWESMQFAWQAMAAPRSFRSDC